MFVFFSILHVRAGGYHPVQVGEQYCSGRYTVLHKLGWGHFSTVWLVRDTHTGQQGAMKVRLNTTAGFAFQRADHVSYCQAGCNFCNLQQAHSPVPQNCECLQGVLGSWCIHSVLPLPSAASPSLSGHLSYQLRDLKRYKHDASFDLCLHAHLQIQKSARHYTEAARDEIQLLSDVRENLPASDDTDTRNCVRLLDWFEHRGPHGLHICMVFEVGCLCASD